MTRNDRKHARCRPKRSRLMTGVAMVLLGLLAVAAPAAATDVCGPIVSDTTWTATGSPYVATCSVLVMSGVKLTIEPNVVVRFNANLALQVDGQLIARGTEGAPITFTKHGDANWGYIWLTDTSVDAQFDTDGQYVSGSIIEHAVIEDAGTTAAESQSGALLLKNAFPFLHAMTIRNNVASGLTAWGLTSAKPLRVTGNTISNNAAPTSGGGINITVVSGSEVVLTDNAVSENTSAGHGGGIYVSGGALTLAQNTVTGNTLTGANGSGGGVYVASTTATLANNRVSGNAATNATYGSGGGIYVYGGTVALTGNVITENAARRGGGIYAFNVASGQLSNNVVLKNSATEEGGGFWTTGFAINLSHNSLVGNSAPTGSAVQLLNATNSFVLNANLIYGNVATTEDTGATLYLVRGYPLINDNDIYGNTAAYELWNDNDQGPETVDATKNWWGTASSSEIMDKIFDYFDNSGKSIVVFSPFLTESNPAAPAPPIDKVGVFRPVDGTFYLDADGSGTWGGCGTDQCLHIGMPGDVPLVGDWNGSGSSKVGLFRPSDGTFYLDYNGNGIWDGCGVDRCLQIGMLNDIPLVGDWNGSGTSKVGAFRPSDGTFYLDYNGSGTWEGCGVDRCLEIGLYGDTPLVGDWKGDLTSKVGVFRPSDGTFYLDYNGNGVWDGCGTDRCLQIGQNGDIPLVGDWDGSGTSKVAAFRPSDGTFYLDYNGSGTWEGCGADRCLQIGMLNDTPLVGDWNGSGSVKVGVFRPSDGTFYLDHNGSGTWEGCGTDRCLQIGMSGDTPLVGKW